MLAFALRLFTLYSLVLFCCGRINTPLNFTLAAQLITGPQITSAMKMDSLLAVMKMGVQIALLHTLEDPITALWQGPAFARKGSKEIASQRKKCNCFMWVF